MDNNLTVSIIGCGWYGKALALSLLKKGITVKGSTTTPEKLSALNAEGIQAFLFDAGAAEDDTYAELFNCDILVIAIPPRSRHGEGGTYVKNIKHIIQIANQYKVKQVIYISSTGVYGDHNQVVNEQTDPRPASESGKLLLEVEGLFRAAESFKTTIIRFGGLFGPGREPGRFFAGKKNIPNGKAPVNLVHLNDCIGITEKIIEKQVFGHTLNACAPHHPTKAVFYTGAAKKAGYELPEFTDELNEWKTVTSNLTNRMLNYEYKVADLDLWLTEEA